MPLDLLAAAALCGLAPLTVAVALARRLRVPIAVVAIAAACYALNLLLQQPVFLGLRPVVGGLDPSCSSPCSRRWSTASSRRSCASGAGGCRCCAPTAPPTARSSPDSPGAGRSRCCSPRSRWPAGRSPAGSPCSCSGGCSLAGHVAFAHLSVAAHRRSAWFLPVAIVAHVVFDASVFGLQVLLDPTSAWPTVLFRVLAAAAVAVTAALRRTGDICAYPRAATDVRITS